MALFGKNKKVQEDEDEHRLTTEDLLNSLSTTRVTIDPNYLKADAEKTLKAYLQAIYTGDTSVLLFNKMTDECYQKTINTLEKDKKNGFPPNIILMFLLESWIVKINFGRKSYDHCHESECHRGKSCPRPGKSGKGGTACPSFHRGGSHDCRCHWRQKEDCQSGNEYDGGRGEDRAHHRKIQAGEP